MINIKNYLLTLKLRQATTGMLVATATVARAVTVLIIFTANSSIYAAILSNDSEQRIQIRYSDSENSNVYLSSPKNATSSSQSISGDSMQGLIEQKQRQYNYDATLSIEENQRINSDTPVYSTRYGTIYTPSSSTNDTIYNSDSYNSENNNSYNNYNVYSTATMNFNSWLNSNSWRAQQVASYQRYLSARLGAQNVPPLNQLLTTARSWDKCGYEPYQLPPQELWSNMVPTLRLYSDLKNQGILPATAEIRSVYRSPSLNACAGGAGGSKHMTAGAIDIWIPEYENNLWSLSKLQDNLCQFWQYQGNAYNFGLGLYTTGAIHLDTEGYRKWGFQNANSSSACRY